MNLKSLKPLGLLALLATTLAVTTASAQTTWYLSRDEVNSEHFNNFALWKSAPTGGTAATAMDATATYDTNGKAVRSQNVVLSTFAGGPLVLNHSGFFLKAITTQITNLTTAATGADIVNSNSSANGPTVGDLKLRVTGTFAVNGNTGLTSGTARTIALEVGTLTGTGNLYIGGPRQASATAATVSVVTIDVTNSLNYTGSVIVGAVTDTSLTFTSNFSSGGALKLTTGGRLNLVNNLSFAGGIFIDDQLINLDAGNYDYASLVAANGSFANVITDNGGHILVSSIPEPSTFATLAGFSVLLLGLMARRRAR